MGNDLTVSDIERQNILNNPYAIEELQKATKFEGIVFEGKYIFLKEQLAEFFEVTPRTIDSYLSKFENELKNNGYEVLRGKRLQDLKDSLVEQHVNEADFINIKTPQIGIFDFRAFLNLGMLIQESERAKLLRTAILDIVIDIINKKTGGGTKYINQRDEDFIISYFHGENYHKEFTDALKNYTDMGNFKYALYTDKIYRSIFKECAAEYKKILNLHAKDNARDTFYAEILDLVSSFEHALAEAIKEAYKKTQKQLNYQEVDRLFKEIESNPFGKPLIERARNKMASRDLAFRDALHLELKEYISPLESTEYERFLGEKSKELIERMEEAKDVFKRLKERE